MASITFNSLRNTSKSEENYTYVDLFLDMTKDVLGSESTSLETTGNGRDIKAAFDLNAIRNSLRNLFSTSKGERSLLPEYGADLRQFIFEPINESTAQRIGRGISRALERWEPRVQLINLDVVGVIDSHEYIITLILGIPFLTEPIKVQTIFSREGFAF